MRHEHESCHGGGVDGSAHSINSASSSSGSGSGSVVVVLCRGLCLTSVVIRM